jgi:hypothetical protein
MALGQDLKSMPVAVLHDREHLANVVKGNVLMEEIAHGIHKYQARG